MNRIRALAIPTPRTRWWLLAAVLLALVAISSGVGIRNGFTYDDVYVIQQNGIVHSLHEWWRLFARSYWPRTYGGDGYRPITMLAFAIEWVVGGGSPAIFHATNVVLYGAVTLAVFWLASALLPLSAAWVVAALFAVQPVHVEAVASTVGQSELWVALLLIVAIGAYVRRRLTGNLTLRSGVAICACYAVALFAKEQLELRRNPGVLVPVLLVTVIALVLPFTIAVFVPSLARGRSSKIPPDSIRSFARSSGWYICALATGPAP